MSEYFRFIFFISNKIRIFFSFIFISNFFFCAYKCSINFLYFSYCYYYLFIRWNFQILRGRMENVRINQNLISFNEIFMAGLCLNCDCVVGDWLLFPLNPLEMLLINFHNSIYFGYYSALPPRKVQCSGMESKRSMVLGLSDWDSRQPEIRSLMFEKTPDINNHHCWERGLIPDGEVDYYIYQKHRKINIHFLLNLHTNRIKLMKSTTTTNNKQQMIKCYLVHFII